MQKSDLATDMKLEVVTLPVTDVDRAKRFYQSLGWRLDADIAVGDSFRVVQVTPPHSSQTATAGSSRRSRPAYLAGSGRTNARKA